jgi:hypothetical protein
MLDELDKVENEIAIEEFNGSSSTGCVFTIDSRNKLSSQKTKSATYASFKDLFKVALPTSFYLKSFFFSIYNV